MPAAALGLPPAEWDAEMMRAGGHFLQTGAWGAFLRATGREVLWAQDDGWWWLGALHRAAGVRSLYCPYGPTVREDGLRALLSVRDAAREAGADFARVEPRGTVDTAMLEAAGAHPTRAVQPRHTWVLDLDGDVDTLRAGLSAGHRHDINAAQRRGLTLRRSVEPSDITHFLSLLHAAVARGAFRPHPDSYFRTMAAALLPRGAATLYFAEAADSAGPVAAAIGLQSPTTRYYAHAAADPERGRRLNAGAPLVWQMLVDAQQDGASAFDFFGVSPPAAANHPWSGFSQFKRSFGGRLVESVGTWDIPVRTVRYRAYRLARSLRR